VLLYIYVSLTEQRTHKNNFILSHMPANIW